ncbi:MAG: segregation and condensation protein [Frankiales bacterium]|nr:segregation and condensation protein [Frankiales bacterium]
MHAAPSSDEVMTDAPDVVPVDAVPLDAATAPAAVDDGAFQVHLDVFEGPFDLLLSLISKHQLDVTEVALHQVTDEFIAFIRAQGVRWELGTATEFLLVAATLLDLKAARLLPSGEVEDEEDLALLEARDLLFARLLQYRAYKQVAAVFAGLFAEQGQRYPRAVSLEPQFAAALPEVLLGIGPQEFARLAEAAFRPREVPTVSVDHIHAPMVSVREHAAMLSERLRRLGGGSFRSLCQDCESTLEIVARFLALLEMYREGQVAFDQVTPLGELHVRWTGGDEAADTTEAVTLGAEWDEPADSDDVEDGERSTAEDNLSNDSEEPA